ncbi:MAG: ROK family protein [Bacteroidetes bacterium]|nr:ROK family protein [Bacteroidota bacterium]
MTLDAGGTNFVFSAIKGNKEIVSPIRKPANANDLGRCLDTVVAGFDEVKEMVMEPVAGISFAFPGPADYKNGIIGDLPNFPAFKGGVPLGPLLEDHFRIPVYINNDGNLFAYGETLAGYMPWLNSRLKTEGSNRPFRNLVGFTLGTGFGSGIVLGEKMVLGHSTSGAEIHNTLNPFNSEWNAEEAVSTRAIQRVYEEQTASSLADSLMPGDIYKIAKGDREGNPEAARESFRAFGRSLGGSIANTLSLFDGIVVLGGGITAAWDLFSPAMFEEINRPYVDFHGVPSPRLSYRVYNFEDPGSLKECAGLKGKELEIPGSGRKVTYDADPRTGVGLSRMGASTAIALGAYAFALQQLDTL